MKEAIKGFLGDRLMIEFGGDVDDDSDLFQLGLLDSGSYIELIRFLEAEFDIEFSNQQILSNVCASVAGMVSLVSDVREQNARRTPQAC